MMRFHVGSVVLVLSLALGGCGPVDELDAAPEGGDVGSVEQGLTTACSLDGATWYAGRSCGVLNCDYTFHAISSALYTATCQQQKVQHYYYCTQMFYDSNGSRGSAATSAQCTWNSNQNQTKVINRSRFGQKCMWGKHWMKTSGGTVVQGPRYIRACS